MDAVTAKNFNSEAEWRPWSYIGELIRYDQINPKQFEGYSDQNNSYSSMHIRLDSFHQDIFLSRQNCDFFLVLFQRKEDLPIFRMQMFMLDQMLEPLSFSVTSIQQQISQTMVSLSTQDVLCTKGRKKLLSINYFCAQKNSCRPGLGLGNSPWCDRPNAAGRVGIRKLAIV